MSNTPARIMRWFGKALLWAFVALLALAVIGAVYQAIATVVDRRTYPPPGQLVEVGGRRLHLRCVGQGTPTVILEAANGGMSAHWVRVQREVARAARVCAYDRGGLGWSERGPTPRDARQISSELHTLLGEADIEDPYVLVGHSYGGLHVRMSATRCALSEKAQAYPHAYPIGGRYFGLHLTFVKHETNVPPDRCVAHSSTRIVGLG